MGETMNVNFVKIMLYIEYRSEMWRCPVEYGFCPTDGSIRVDVFKPVVQSDNGEDVYYLDETSDLFEDIKSECEEYIKDIRIIKPFEKDYGFLDYRGIIIVPNE